MSGSSSSRMAISSILLLRNDKYSVKIQLSIYLCEMFYGSI